MAVSPHVSVVIPAYNEVESVGECVRELAGALKGLGEICEILVIDDGSTDGTFEILKHLHGEVPELRAWRFSRRCGQSAALAAGFRQAAGEVVVTMDADMQNDPADIPRLLDALRQCDVVCGVRVKRQDGLVRWASGRIANGVRNKLGGENLRDTGCSLKAYRRGFLARLKMFDGLHRFLPTLLKLEGARLIELPVNHRPRLGGKSKYNVWNRVFRSLRDFVAVQWMKRRFIRHEIEEEL